MTTTQMNITLDLVIYYFIKDCYSEMNLKVNKSETDQNKLRKLIIPEKAKQIENEKKFNLTKFNKKERLLIEKKSDYEYKTDDKLNNFDIKLFNGKSISKKNDLLLISSKTTIEESKNARKILENVMDKVESNKKDYLDNIRKMTEITEKN